MGWSLGFDSNWNRDIGYGVPAYCDHPGCKAEIDRGLGYVCGGEPYGGDGCGLYFCGSHLWHKEFPNGYRQACERCRDDNEEKFEPTADHPDWIDWKLTHESWAGWREKHPDEVTKLKAASPSLGREVRGTGEGPA